MSSRSLNKVLLIGNLTRDPELRYTPQGTPVCTFGLATNRSWQPSAGGDRQEETEFHRIVAWNKLAELCAELLFKGRKTYVEGRLQTRNWTTAEGQERQTVEVVIDNMIVLDSKRREGQSDQGVEYESESGYEPMGNQGDDGADYKDLEEDGGEDQSKKETDDQKATKKATKKEEEVEVDDIPF